jgi:hypothetical protein
MSSWTAWDIAQRRMAELNSEAASRRPGHPQVAGVGARSGHVKRRWQTLSVWVRYRMIGLGCRLARPAVIAGARSGA